jgi:hypothetical protein
MIIKPNNCREKQFTKALLLQQSEVSVYNTDPLETKPVTKILVLTQVCILNILACYHNWKGNLGQSGESTLVQGCANITDHEISCPNHIPITKV